MLITCDEVIDAQENFSDDSINKQNAKLIYYIFHTILLVIIWLLLLIIIAMNYYYIKYQLKQKKLLY